MDLSAATATGPDLHDLAAVAAIVAPLWFAAYVVACAIWPYTKCGKCEGKGRHRSPSGKHWRKCRRCKGSGDRLRFGRHVWNRLRAKTSDT